jgi:hypothetical protein
VVPKLSGQVRVADVFAGVTEVANQPRRRACDGCAPNLATTDRDPHMTCRYAPPAEPERATCVCVPFRARRFSFERGGERSVGTYVLAGNRCTGSRTLHAGRRNRTTTAPGSDRAARHRRHCDELEKPASGATFVIRRAVLRTTRTTAIRSMLLASARAQNRRSAWAMMSPVSDLNARRADPLDIDCEMSDRA